MQFCIATVVGLCLAATLAGCGKKDGDLSTTAPMGLQPPKTTVKQLDALVVGYPLGGIVLGQAYDYVGQRFLPSVCVTGKRESLGARDLRSDFRDLLDRQQIFDSLKVSASAEFGGKGLGGSGSASFARTVNIDRQNRNILATVEVMKDGEQLVPPDNAATVQFRAGVEKEKNKFRPACGDGYAAAIRRGGKLHMMFSWKLETEDVKEIINASGSGSYGLSSGKASADKIRERLKTKGETVAQVHMTGGNREKTPDTAKDAVEFATKFGAINDEQSTPLEVVILPYRLLSGASDWIRNLPLPDSAVRDLPAHYWRLSELANLYARAHVAEFDYYHPLSDPKSHSDTAKVLQSAAFCVAEMVDMCNRDQVCAFEQLAAKAAAEIWSCREGYDGSQLTPLQAAKVLEASLGRRGLRAALKAQPRVTTDDKLKAVLEQAKLMTDASQVALLSDLKIASSGVAASGAKLPVPVRINDGWSESVHDIWYRNYARAPWPKAVTTAGGTDTVQPGDIHSLLQIYCESMKWKCDNVKNDVLSGSAEKEGHASSIEVLEGMIVAYRLAPLAAGICAINLSHPLCQFPDTLRGYLTVSDPQFKAQFGADRWFYLFTKAQPPQEPRRKNYPPPEPRRNCAKPMVC